MQITPESLEALLLHKHAYIPRMFGDLRFIVIDEVHSLMRGDRGGQTLCLIERLSKLAGVNPRRIGLSATIGDLETTGNFLSSGTGRNTVVPKIEVKGAKWRLSMEHFYIQGTQSAEDKNLPDALPVMDIQTDTAPQNADPGMGYIFEHTREKVPGVRQLPRGMRGGDHHAAAVLRSEPGTRPLFNSPWQSVGLLP